MEYVGIPAYVIALLASLFGFLASFAWTRHSTFSPLYRVTRSALTGSLLFTITTMMVAFSYPLDTGDTIILHATPTDISALRAAVTISLAMAITLYIATMKEMRKTGTRPGHTLSYFSSSLLILILATILVPYHYMKANIIIDGGLVMLPSELQPPPITLETMAPAALILAYATLLVAIVYNYVISPKNNKIH